MKMFLKMAASFLLIFNGAGAIYGGWNLITHPDGSTMQMSVDLLKHSPFSDFLMPGLILLLTNGVFCILARVAILFETRNYQRYIIGEGIILLGWLTVQMIMIEMIVALHAVLGAIAILLIIFGWLLSEVEQKPKVIAQ